MQHGSLFAGLPLPVPGAAGQSSEAENAFPARASQEEVFETLFAGGKFRLERIVSTGQSTPPGEWLEQPEAEWVILLTGAAVLRFESPPAELSLQPGDWVQIPPGSRHRVESTSRDMPSVWLAVHYTGG
ncbi:MAG: cupin domain-containing protein [Planctomycetaceae bacterium]|nr:cupin domain-containing protein [Planctomycetaceae bacterium]